MSSAAEVPHYVLYTANIALTASTFVSGISWGVMTSLYSVCMYILLRDLRKTKFTTKKSALLAIWISALWVLSSISTIANACATIYAYSWELNYPGGPIFYLGQEWNAPIAVLAYTTYILTMWLADAMVLWRAFVISAGVYTPIRGLIISFLFLIYLGVIGTGCYVIALLRSDRTLYSDFSLKAAVPCFSLSVALNVLATAFITIRLFIFKRMSEQAMGRKEASPYTSIMAMLVESMALYAIWSLVFIVTYALNNPGQYILLMTLCSVQVIAPILIVYRVFRGRGWEQNTDTKIPSTSAGRKVTFSEKRARSTIRQQEFHDELSAGLKGDYYNTSSSSRS